MGDAVLVVADGDPLSYAEIFSRAKRFADFIRQNFGLGTGSRVAIAVREPTTWIVSFIAITSIGATAVLIRAEESENARHYLRIARCSLLVTDAVAETSNLVDTVGICVVAKDEFFSLGRKPNGEDSQLSLPSQGEALISFTSGTTGAPKGVILTHLGIITGLMNMMLGGLLAAAESGDAGRHSPSTRRTPCTLVLSPLCYIGGYSQLLLMLTLGGKVIFSRDRDAASLASLVESEQVRSIVGINDSQLRELMRLKADSGPLTSIGVYGAALNASLLAEIWEHWPNVVVGSGYGMTETAGSIAVIAGEALKRNPTSSGRVLPSVQIKVTASDGRQLAIGEVGEICVRGANLMRSYCTESGEEQPLRDGWFKTGDIGYLSADHHLYITGRSSHVLVMNEREIFYREVEQALMTRHALSEVAVMSGGPEEGPILSVAAVPARGTHTSVESIVHSLQQHFGFSPAAVKVELLEALPRSFTGKVDLHQLRKK